MTERIPLSPYGSEGSAPDSFEIPEHPVPALPPRPYEQIEAASEPVVVSSESVDPREECDRTMITPTLRVEKSRGRKSIGHGFAI